VAEVRENSDDREEDAEDYAHNAVTIPQASRVGWGGSCRPAGQRAVPATPSTEVSASASRSYSPISL
jgi:hypothetical protein